MPSSWTKWSLLALLATATFAISGRSDVKRGDQMAKERKNDDKDQIAKGQTVILGTWTWNIAKNEQGGANADIWWEQVTDQQQFLVPKGRAGLALIEKKAFEKISRGDLANLKYSDQKLANNMLTPGAVLAIRTNDGNFAKLKVVGYRELHDFSFPEAKLLREDWKQFVLQKPNTKNYHLEVEWVLYRK